MGLFVLLLAALNGPSLHVSGPSTFVAKVRRQIELEMPEVAWVDVDHAQLRFEVRRDDAALWLRFGDERRRLGNADDEAAATRICVLLISRRVRSAAVESAVVVESSAPAEPVGAMRDPPVWSVEGGVAFWPGPTRGSAHLGGTAAVRREAFGPVALGARLLGVALCCGAERDNVRVSGWWAGAFAEVSVGHTWGVFALDGSVAGGVAAEVFDGQVVGLFAGPTAAERTTRVLPVGRVAVAGSVALYSSARLVVRGGLHLAPVARVRLPAPLDEGRAPVERAALLPFGEVSLAIGLGAPN
ncbi:MAG: hypothetical protein RIT81_28095 [Deltaproteobacteria bacterium]